MIYIGLPQWSHPKWVRLGITSLEEYARHFNCVEGNTTLYALPKPEVVLRWREQTTDDFRFCFKFPATISHQAALRHCDDLVTEFLTRMSPLAPRIGQYWLQLPATFGPRELPALWHFLDSLPGESKREIFHSLMLQKLPDMLILMLLFVPSTSRRFFQLQ